MKQKIYQKTICVELLRLVSQNLFFPLKLHLQQILSYRVTQRVLYKNVSIAFFRFFDFFFSFIFGGTQSVIRTEHAILKLNEFFFHCRILLESKRFLSHSAMQEMFFSFLFFLDLCSKENYFLIY